MDPRKVRIATYREEFEVDHYWVSDDWSSIRKNSPVLYPGFSIKDRSKASQILYVKEYRPGCEWYGIPEYISAANWIELEWEIAMFHLSSIRQGFHPSMVINFANAVPSEEEMDSVIRRLRDEYEGASRGGKVIFTFSDSKDTAPVITYHTFTFNGADYSYLLPDALEDITGISWDVPDSTGVWQIIKNYRVDKNYYDTDTSSIKQALILKESPMPGRTVNVQYTKFPTVITDSQELTASGLPASCEDVVRFGAMYRLLTTVDPGKVTATAVSADALDQPVQAGASTNAAKYLFQLYTVRLAEEIAKQQANFLNTIQYTR